MRFALRALDVSIGVGVFVYDSAKRLVRVARSWPWPAEPVRTDPAEVAGLSNDAIDFLMSRDSKRRS